MTRRFETSEITKLLDVLIGDVEAVGETNEDNRRLDNLKTLIDVTNWCLDGLQFAMASGYGRPEWSMKKKKKKKSVVRHKQLYVILRRGLMKSLKSRRKGASDEKRRNNFIRRR